MDTRDRLDEALERLELTISAYRNGDYMGTLRGLGNALMHMQEATAELVPIAYREGATKKAISEALHMGPNGLRGIRLER